MTGLETLALKMSERFDMSIKAATVALNKPTVQKIITILAENSDLADKIGHEEFKAREEQFDNDVQKLLERTVEIEASEKWIAVRESELESREAELQEEESKFQDALDVLCQLESPESRDKIRLFLVFKNAVKNIGPETPQNKTAVIQGMGYILSGVNPVRSDTIDENVSRKGSYKENNDNAYDAV